MSSTTKDLLIKEWFSNLYYERNNKDTILLLEDLDGTLENKIYSFLPEKKATSKHIFTLYDLRSKISFPSIQNPKNEILIISADKNSIQHPKLNLDNINAKILYVPADYTDFYFNIGKYIKPSDQNNTTFVRVPSNERHLYFLEKVNLHTLLTQNRTFLWLNEYLDFMHDRFYTFCNEINCRSLLVKGTTFKEETYKTDMKNDIILFVTYNILTSRMAVVVYRIAFLDPHANVTKIGRYFQKMSGSKSKVFSIKTHKSLANIPDLKGKSFKAYDFNVNETEMVVREEIAIKLTELDIKELDAQKIYEITGYPYGGLKH